MRAPRPVRTLSTGIVVAALLLAACGSSDDGGSGAAGPDDATTLDGLKVGLIMGGPKNDNGFYQAGFEGIERAADEHGIEPTVVENVTPAEAEQVFRDLADAGNELIIGMGADFEDGGVAVAPDHPDVQFVVMNGRETGPNLATYALREGQVAFLATYLVALTQPESTTFGLVGGIEIPPHIALRDGMDVALDLAERDSDLLATFTGSFVDVALAKEATSAQINNGATVIVPWSGSAVDGAFDAVSEHSDVGVIAALVDRCGEAPYFLASAVADPGGLVAQVVEDYGSDGWDPSGSAALGLEDPDVARVEPCGEVPDEVQAQVDEMRLALIEATVPDLPSGI